MNEIIGLLPEIWMLLQKWRFDKKIDLDSLKLNVIFLFITLA